MQITYIFIGHQDQSTVLPVASLKRSCGGIIALQLFIIKPLSKFRLKFGNQKDWPQCAYSVKAGPIHMPVNYEFF